MRPADASGSAMLRGLDASQFHLPGAANMYEDHHVRIV